MITCYFSIEPHSSTQDRQCSLQKILSDGICLIISAIHKVFSEGFASSREKPSAK